jgi:hypothetical protein
MPKTVPFIIPAMFCISALAGCSGNPFTSLGGGGGITTSSINSAPAKTAAAAPKVDPACVALASQIETLRKDGVTGRIEKASVGKTRTVSVRRDSLAKIAELEKANAEFQSKCSTISPIAAQAPASPAQAPAPAAAPVAALAPAQPAAPTAVTAKVRPTIEKGLEPGNPLRQ